LKDSQSLIEYKQVGIKFGHNWILRDVNFKINPGDYVAFIGANGSGKSTLIKATLGMISKNEGKILVNGSIIEKSDNVEKVIKQSFGYVPQYTSISRDFPITVREVLTLECKQSNCPVNVEEHLKLFNSVQIVDQSISELSGGEFQKMLISRALIKDPDVLILDEPVNNLDHDSKEELFSKLKKLNKEQGKTVILVSHDHNLLENMNIRLIKFEDQTTTEIN
jgi:zinc transport system ATP-binding protein